MLKVPKLCLFLFALFCLSGTQSFAKGKALHALIVDPTLYVSAAPWRLLKVPEGPLTPGRIDKVEFVFSGGDESQPYPNVMGVRIYTGAEATLDRDLETESSFFQKINNLRLWCDSRFLVDLLPEKKSHRELLKALVAEHKLPLSVYNSTLILDRPDNMNCTESHENLKILYRELRKIRMETYASVPAIERHVLRVVVEDETPQLYAYIDMEHQGSQTIDVKSASGESVTASTNVFLHNLKRALDISALSVVRKELGELISLKKRLGLDGNDLSRAKMLYKTVLGRKYRESYYQNMASALKRTYTRTLTYRDVQSAEIEREVLETLATTHEINPMTKGLWLEAMRLREPNADPNQEFPY